MNLSHVVNENQIRLDADSLAHWGKDWTNGLPVAPSAIVFPESNAQVQELVRYAVANQLALVPSGGRTGLSGGAVASQGEVVVSFDRMNQILDFSPEDKVVKCQAGTITANLQAFAEEQGMFYPVDFASSGSSQIGGNVATNAGGIKVIRYGLTRDWVAGLTAVTGRGDLVACNHGLVKNATGYDLRHLLIGSEGTLGLICEVDMRLASQPEPQTVMVLGVPKVADLLSVLQQFSAKLTLSAFEFFSDLALTKVQQHRSLPDPLTSRVENYALLEFDESALDAAEAAFSECLDKGWITDGVLSQSAAQAKALWQLREGISESIACYTPYKNDLSVRIADVPDFLSDVDGYVSKAYPDFEVCWYGHIGDGNLHLNILRPDRMSVDEFFAHGNTMSPEIFKLVSARNGSISAEHGVGLLKRDYLDYSRSGAELDLMHGLKQLFDPAHILNPGKLLQSTHQS
ncbi:MAG TPA: FAD-binding oxidoreductase [Gammaproteobacteria bacterium]|nr:FAD-binding oxidoreductase [Gammaproteobacteria bacterium]|tara:strand:+ start:13392 stop:14768 length:1377 start_codon:yes stop_codon:yes gene_type:complete